MLNLGGVVILMQKNLVDFNEFNIKYVIGNAYTMEQMQRTPVKLPFDETIMNFLNLLSKTLLSKSDVKRYPDIVTLAFWLRKSSIEKIKLRFQNNEKLVYRLGRGIIFHIAPSNVPLNFVYSLVVGLLCGNKNVVRIPSKEFEQIGIICEAIVEAMKAIPDIIPYICLVKYGHDKLLNDALSDLADVRIIWGGDNTINEIRKSPLKPRSTEITFADRYSLAVIDSDTYMSVKNKMKIANDFYNDTYLSDQNACTSPKAVVWMGSQIEEAKDYFWKELHLLVEDKYEISGVQAVNKLTSGYRLAAAKEGVKKVYAKDNLIVRMSVPRLTVDILEYKDNSGYFFEYDCDNILELKDFCDDTRCQTLAYIGDIELIKPLAISGIAGIDRVVPIGKTMDFDLIWDGYNLSERLTRSIAMD